MGLRASSIGFVGLVESDRHETPPDQPRGASAKGPRGPRPLEHWTDAELGQAGFGADEIDAIRAAVTPEDLFECVAKGIDLFDCVLPTRNARNGQLFTRAGRLNIKNAQFAEDPSPADPGCGCYTCGHFSRACLRHLFLAGEMTAATLNTVHNLFFYLDTMRRIREALVFGTFEKLRQEFRRTYSRQSSS